jgi:DNA-binding MarR family transcriptional regulator
MKKHPPRDLPDLQLVAPLGDAHLGLEARAQADDHIDVKVWLRLLACSAQIEQTIRQRLRNRFGTSLPRFDYLAQLERHPDGLRMNVLSRYLMVTGGNVTGLTDQLVAEGLVERVDDPEDRRSCRVVLTARGRSDFARMAEEHEQWLRELFDGIAPEAKDQLYALLGALRVNLTRRQAELDAEPPEPRAARAPLRRSTP